MPSIKVYNARDVDELVLLDVSATDEKREPDYLTISELCDECFVPLTYGGGVTNIEVIRKLLLSGADKVAINTFAYSEPEFIREASARYGSQCIVASIDVKEMTPEIMNALVTVEKVYRIRPYLMVETP